MVTVVQEKGFERDLKLCRKEKGDLSKFYATIGALSLGETLGKQKKNHKLSGKWKEYWECHTEQDWLLIYQVNKNIIILVKTGKHANLFRNSLKV